MAKMKPFAVKVRYSVEETIFVEARRPAGAVERAFDPKTYRDAHAYDCVEDCYCGLSALPKNAEVVEVRAL